MLTPPHVRERRRQRQARLVSLGYSSYPEYLRSSHWQQVKARYRASDQPQDCICGDTERLQLHHLTYERVGAEELSDLTPLCGNCHAMIHVLELRGDVGLDFTGFVSQKRAERYAAERGPQVSFKQERAEERERQLREGEKQFVVRLLIYRAVATRKGMNLDSDLKVVLRAFRRMQHKMGEEPQFLAPGLDPA